MATTQIIGGHRVSEQVLGAVREASRRTGVDFNYMMAKAAQESGFRADAEARTSSATGLYQFIETTWLDMVRDHGAKHGLGGLAGAIADGPDGNPMVTDTATRRQILELRRDPRLNAVMAGELANDNKAHLDSTVGGEIGTTELYLAHFLGARSAATFLDAMRTTPDRPAASLFPAAARANRAVFFDPSTGAARSLEAVHGYFGRSLGAVMAQSDPAPNPAWTQMTFKAWTDPAKTGTRAPAAGAGPGWSPGQQPLAVSTLLYLKTLPIPGKTA